MSEPVHEFVSRAPHPRLQPFIDVYMGYRLEGFSPGVHAGLPSRSLTLIVAFDSALDVERTGPDGTHRDDYWSMIGGLHSRPALVRHDGNQHGVQISLTPRAAMALFGMPSIELSHQVVDLPTAAPAFGAELVERLSGLDDWSARWRALDEVFLRVLVDEATLGPELEHAWSLLLASNGLMPVGDLAAEVGWSRRHLAESFKAHCGLSPKVMGRVLRFERAQTLLRLPTAPAIAAVAAHCGYADQAHMTREWRRLAGVSPTVWLQDETLPEQHDLPNVQDLEGVPPSS